MDHRRGTDKTKWARILQQLKRSWIDVVVLMTMFGLSFMLPDTQEEAQRAGSQLNLLALFITKTNSILWPWLIVDIVRKWKWPYLDLQQLVTGKDREGNDIRYAWAGIFFLLGIYYVVIFAFATGG